MDLVGGADPGLARPRGSVISVRWLLPLGIGLVVEAVGGYPLAVSPAKAKAG